MTEEKKQWRGDIIDNTDFIYAVSKEYSQIYKGHRKFHKSQYQKLKYNLIPCIQYENVIYLSIEDWMKVLKVDNHANVLHRLEPLKWLIEVRSSRVDESVEKGFIKVLINPEYAWRVSQQKDRVRAIKEFRLFQDLSETSIYDVTLSPFYEKRKAERYETTEEVAV